MVLETGPGTGVAGRTDLLDGDEQGIAVAVERDRADPLDVTAGVPLAPVLLAGPRPEGHPTSGQGAAQGLVVHPTEHQHFQGVVLLNDGGDQPGCIARKARCDGGIESGHRTILPSGPPWSTMTSMPATHVAHLERDRFCDALELAGPVAPTLCEGWLTRDLAAHVVLRERRPDLAAGILVPGLGGRLERAQAELAQTAWESLVSTVRGGPPFWHPTRFSAVDDAVNTIEFVVHHEDVLRGDGAPGPRRRPDAATSKAVWGALRRMAPLMFRRSQVPVTLRTPEGRSITAAKGDGPGVVIAGAPIELLLTAYGRAAAALTHWEGSEEDIATVRGTRLGLA